MGCLLVDSCTCEKSNGSAGGKILEMETDFTTKK